MCVESGRGFVFNFVQDGIFGVIYLFSFLCLLLFFCYYFIDFSSRVTWGLFCCGFRGVLFLLVFRLLFFGEGVSWGVFYLVFLCLVYCFYLVMTLIM